jgi:hypothetical protein
VRFTNVAASRAAGGEGHADVKHRRASLGAWGRGVREGRGTRLLLLLLWSLQSAGFSFSMAASRSFVVDIIIVVVVAAMSRLVWRGPAQGCLSVATMLSLPLSLDPPGTGHPPSKHSMLPAPST